MRSNIARVEYGSSGRLGYSCFAMPTWSSWSGSQVSSDSGRINVLEIRSTRSSKTHFVSTIASESNNLSRAQAPGLKVNGRFAKHLDLNDGDEIVVRDITETPVSVARVWVRCESADDWEILEPNSEILSSNLLNQLRVVYSGLKFPFWITKSMTVNLIIDKVEPECELGLLDNNSEVIIPALAQSPQPQMKLSSSQCYLRLHPLVVHEDFQNSLLQLPSLKLLLTNRFHAFVRLSCLPLNDDKSPSNADCFVAKFAGDTGSDIIVKVFILDKLDIDKELLESSFPLTNPPCVFIHSRVLSDAANNATESVLKMKSTVLIEQVQEHEYDQKIEFCPLQAITQSESQSRLSFGGFEQLIREGLDFLSASLSLGHVQHNFVGPMHGNLHIAGREGSGKTSFATRLTQELTEFPFYVHSELIACAKLRGKKPDSLEKELHAAFDRATKLQPSVVILDDFDSLIPNSLSEQENLAEEFQHFRTSETILPCISKCRNQQISFIVTSSGTDTIHAYWRTRPGFQFFQKLLYIPSPDSRDRLGIFKKCLHRYRRVPERTTAASPSATCADASHAQLQHKPETEEPPQPQPPTMFPDLIKSTATAEACLSLRTRHTIERDRTMNESCHCCLLSDSIKRSIDSVHDEYATAQFFSDLAQRWALHLFKNQTSMNGGKFTCDDETAFAQLIQDAIQRIGSASKTKSAPKITWDQIGGLSDVKSELIKILQWPIKYAKLFQNAPVQLPCGILFYGYPGTGKTLLGLSLPSVINAKFIHVKGPELLSKYIGASEQAVKDIFKRARDSKPCILFFDEFDSLVPRRGHDSTGVTDRVVNQFLAEMDGVDGGLGAGVYLIASTSRPDLIDPAVLRPGRLDKCLFFSLSSQDERIEILKRQSEEMNFSQWNKNDWDEIGRETEGFTGADLHSLLFSAQLAAIHEYLDKLNIDPELSTSSWKNDDNARAASLQKSAAAPVVSKADIFITARHMKEALRTFQPSLYGKEFEKFQSIFQTFSMARSGQRTLATTTGSLQGMEQRATLA